MSLYGNRTVDIKVLLRSYDNYETYKNDIGGDYAMNHEGTELVDFVKAVQINDELSHYSELWRLDNCKNS